MSLGVPFTAALLGALIGAVLPGAGRRLATPTSASPAAPPGRRPAPPASAPPASAPPASGPPASGPPASAPPASGPSRSAGDRPFLAGRVRVRRVPSWVPAATGAVVGAVVLGTLAAALDGDPGLPAVLAMAAVGLILAVVDLTCLRLPDPLVATAGLLGAAGLTAAALLAGTPGRLFTAVAAAAVCGFVQVLLALAPGSRLGFGDVKLGTVLGLPLGWLGWSTVLTGLVLPHLLNGLAVLGLLATGRVRRDTALPVGPALLAGTWLALLTS
ncbi:prepilin peptidase [Micromonospora yangpuensis]|uniref:prepilin peptidase n=1 Tax=Micromonospora yangpuensis TaxID=683228 RepID=UPI001E458673|nr:A24 family peptidase [Micromonospora yangpuensis]